MQNYLNSQFVFSILNRYFFTNLTCFTNDFQSSNIYRNCRPYAITASYLQLSCCKTMTLWRLSQHVGSLWATMCDFLERVRAPLKRRGSCLIQNSLFTARSCAELCCSYSIAVRHSVRPSVGHTPVLCQNEWT